MQNTYKENQDIQFVQTSVRPSVTEYDYGYTDKYKWDGSFSAPNKTAYKNALKLSNEYKLKFEKLNTLIGFEVDFIIGKKTYKAIIVAVSIPDSKVTLYPTGEINPYSKKEHAHVYSSYPFEFNLSIDGRINFWSRKIENLDLSNAKNVGVFFESKKNPTKFLKFKDLKSIPSNFI